MRLCEIRGELESYGINHRSFFEKSDLIRALEQARATSGFHQSERYNAQSDRWTTASSSKSHYSSSSYHQQHQRRKTPTPVQEAWIQDEMRAARYMPADNLRRTLQTWGISTAGLWTHEELLRAYAEAMVMVDDGTEEEEEMPYDPAYRDVIVVPMAIGDPRAATGRIIDIELRRMAP